MEALFYILPLLFGIAGWATEYMELMAMGGVLAFYTSYNLISDASPLTDNVIMLAVVYVALALSMLLRIVVEYSKEE